MDPFFWGMGGAHGPDPGARLAANQAASDARRSQSKVEELERRLDRLSLACMALWELLQQKAHVPEAEFMAKVQEIDLRDGKLDGKAGAAPARSCPSCQRMLSQRHRRCLYCGYQGAQQATDAFS